MAGVLLVIAFIVAGVVTGEAGFYYVAAGLVGLYLAAVVSMALFVGSRIRKIEQGFDECPVPYGRHRNGRRL